MGCLSKLKINQHNQHNKWNPLAQASLHAKLLIILFLVFTITVLTLTYQVEKNMEATHITLVKDELRSLAAIAAVSINGDVVDELREPEQQTTESYMALKASIIKIMEANRNIQDIYIMRKGSTNGDMFFVVDADPKEPAQFGEPYDARDVPSMLAGFDQPSVDNDFVTDKWGMTLSGYAPVKNSQEQVVAIVGIDFDAHTIRAGIERRREQILLYTAMGMLVMVLISLLLAQSIVGRLNRVKRAIDIILESDSKSCQICQGKDEVDLLASQVNNLIERVAVEKEQVLISIIMTLVNTLEVRDQYTHGHSAEVAAMVTDILDKLEVSTEEKFTINFAALLHDIGKIGIADTILNKTDKLTDDEFDIIKQHPVIGAKILEGISSLNQIREIVKHHHERYDGRGYPDKLEGEDILFGARVIAVADSFQAMISDRPYRQGMSQAAAMEELACNKGTQFDPQLVEVFLSICKTKQYKKQ